MVWKVLLCASALLVCWLALVAVGILACARPKLDCSDVCRDYVVGSVVTLRDGSQACACVGDARPSDTVDATRGQ